MNGDESTIERRYLFHGEALALAAHIRRPKDYFVKSVASSVLSITGGIAEAQERAGEAGVISYASAATRATGDFVPSEEAVKFTHGNHGDNLLPTVTVVDSSVTGFKIDVPQEHSGFRLFGRSSRVVYMDQLSAHMESASDRRTPNAFRVMKVSFPGVVVDGKTLIVETNTGLFTEKYTKRKLDCALDDADFRQSCSHQILGEWPGITLATVATRLYWQDGAPPETKIEGHRLIVNGLGSLYFGELIIQEGLRRLTLVRFQLGSPDGGDGTVVQATSNGQTMPPQLTGP